MADSVSKSVPKLGENIATVTDVDGDFQTSSRKFFALPGEPTQIEVPLIAPLEDGELAIVLMWT